MEVLNNDGNDVVGVWMTHMSLFAGLPEIALSIQFSNISQDVDWNPIIKIILFLE